MSTDLTTYQNATRLQPADLSDAMHLSKVLADSAIIPYALRGKPADILVIMMYGMELGLSVNQAMRGINVIKGRPSLSAELRVAKTRERGHRVGVVCAECGEWPADHGPASANGGHRYQPDWTPERCTVKAVRADTGETSIVTWTVQDAVTAGLLRRVDSGKLVARSDKGEVLPWEAHPRDMLYARASERACKHIAPEVAYGLYTRDEIEAMPDEPVRVTAEAGEPLTAEAIHEEAATIRAQVAEQVQPTEPEDADGPLDTRSKLARRMFALFGEIGMREREDRIRYINEVIAPRSIASSSDMTVGDARAVVLALEDEQKAGMGDAG